MRRKVAARLETRERKRRQNGMMAEVARLTETRSQLQRPCLQLHTGLRAVEPTCGGAQIGFQQQPDETVVV